MQDSTSITNLTLATPTSAGRSRSFDHLSSTKKALGGNGLGSFVKLNATPQLLATGVGLPQSHLNTHQDGLPSCPSVPTGPRAERIIQVPDTSVIDYRRDYYKELGINTGCSATALSDAMQAANEKHAKQQEAFQILSDNYLRKVYDDARAFALEEILRVKEHAHVEEPPRAKDLPELERRERAPRINLHRNYYRELGTEPKPGVKTESIERAYYHKSWSLTP